MKVKGNSLVFKFGGKPGYQQFDFYRFNVAIVPQHVFKNYRNDGHHDGQPGDKSKLVGTGPYLYQSGDGATSTTRRLEEARDWWATKALDLNVAPKYVVDIKNGTNAAALEPAGGEHRPVQQLRAEDGHQGRSPRPTSRKAPYHLGANTTWLFPNTTNKPLNDQQFRRALAYSINMSQIISKSVPGPRQQGEPDRPAADLGQVHQQVGRHEVRLLVQRGEGEELLTTAGYKDTNGDGYVENKDGSKINLTSPSRTGGPTG